MFSLPRLSIKNAADAYRRIELDARIEASTGLGLTVICLEEAIVALHQALLALERAPHQVPSEPLSRAQSIAVWLGRSVEEGNPMREALMQFYGGLAASLGRNMLVPNAAQIAAVKRDLTDVLSAAQSGSGDRAAAAA